MLFNTHTFFLRLEEAGFERKQAEAITETFTEVQRESLAEAAKTTLASKKDITRLEGDIAQVRLEIRDSKVDIIKWVVTLFLAQTGILVALFKYMI